MYIQQHSILKKKKKCLNLNCQNIIKKRGLWNHSCVHQHYKGRGEDSSQTLLSSEATNLKAVNPRPRGLGFYPERAPYFVAFSTPIEHQRSEVTNSSCKPETKMTVIYPSSDSSPENQSTKGTLLIAYSRALGKWGALEWCQRGLFTMEQG